MEKRAYLCIDLKSFYASVECVERGLDPMTTNLVVADPARSDKTICLAVSPSMKALGVRNRCRVFEIPRDINYIMAPPRMKRYMDYAAEIYGVYLRYISKDDIHVYSIDEAFFDVTEYLAFYRMTAKELARHLMDEVLRETGIRATAGVGTNLYLAKIALDITAKHAEDFIGELDEESYRATMWRHQPLTDFWRVGVGTAQRLERYGITTMEGIAHADEEFLYRLFGVDAELLIDHAYGREPTGISDIKSYRSKVKCLSSGQVLMRDYTFSEAETVLREMADQMCLDLAEKGLVTDSLSLAVGYSNSLHRKMAGGSASLSVPTHAPSLLIPAALTLYRRTVDPAYPIRRIHLNCSRVTPAGGARQISFFEEPTAPIREEKIQRAVLGIKQRFGKNAILKGTSLTEEATARERNQQIGGHKSGEE